MKKISLTQLSSRSSVKTLVAKTAATAAKKVAASAGKQGLNFKLNGLVFYDIERMPALTWGDLVDRYETHAIGDGQWSIEVYDSKGNLLREFVGSNGTRYNEEPNDLWAAYDKWSKGIYRYPGEIKNYKAPDGTVGTMSFFYREARKRKLHGLVMVF